MVRAESEGCLLGSVGIPGLAAFKGWGGQGWRWRLCRRCKTISGPIPPTAAMQHVGCAQAARRPHPDRDCEGIFRSVRRWFLDSRHCAPFGSLCSGSGNQIHWHPPDPRGNQADASHVRAVRHIRLRVPRHSSIRPSRQRPPRHDFRARDGGRSALGSSRGQMRK